MCDKCYILTELFKAAESNSHQNYIPTLSFIKEMIKQGRIELYAGDCPIEEVEKNLNDEIHYTIRHYFKCKTCDRYFFIGDCIRGVPVYKIIDNIKTVNFDNMLWGRYGTLYEENELK
ncbi:MAG: hypothetical protein LIR50_03300 [Bacillota bacterium]|nr:hypothetical protein [Bacillota bacterium]